MVNIIEELPVKIPITPLGISHSSLCQIVVRDGKTGEIKDVRYGHNDKLNATYSALISAMIDRLWKIPPHYVRLVQAGSDKQPPKKTCLSPADCGVASAHWLEYDDERSGSFAPLEAVPDDKIVVLGLVTTKTPRRETVEDLIACIREASRFVPLERLALSPQCGFSTSIHGNRIEVADQKHKLKVIVDTARTLWG